MRLRVAALCLVVGAAPRPAGAQAAIEAAGRAESLSAAGRPWHAAEALLAARSVTANVTAELTVAAARAALHARRYDRARALLATQPWLDEYEHGEALALLAEAEAGLALHAQAAARFAAAANRAREPVGALYAVRAGLAYEAAGQFAEAAHAFGVARATPGLAAIEAWLRLREARVTPDTVAAARLLVSLPPLVAREAPAARAAALLASRDTAAAVAAYAQAGKRLDAGRLALARGDTTRARALLYEAMARAPESDDAVAASGLARGALAPASAAERVTLARALRPRGSPEARRLVTDAVRAGDSSAATLMYLGELEASAGRFAASAAAYAAAARDSATRPLALYRRARVLLRANDAGAVAALEAFAQTYPQDTAAPVALYLAADARAERGDWTAAAAVFGALFNRHPADPRASTARFRLAARALDAGRPDSAAALYAAEVEALGPQRAAARFWLGKLAIARGDSAAARAGWRTLALEDSLGYYGLRARRDAGLPPLRLDVARLPDPPPAMAAALGRIDTLVLAGLDAEARAEVRAILANPPDDVDALLAWSGGLAERGFGPAAVRLGWQAFARAPADGRTLRAIWPWPNRAAVEAEAAEFGLDPLLFAGLVRQESIFDAEALSPAGARGLAQLMPGTAALTARGLDVTFYPDWITVPDLNLHLGAAHFAELLRQYDGRVDAAVAAYNAGGRPVGRWLRSPGALDPDQFIEGITYPETRGYVRSVLRNRELYRALYGANVP
jgi:soluble lytic murein transglycosylase